MRIQHNILAMNAYRNYNTNTSALAKNLEKLSSGYKINRAGDDAAGLAISEKMRAQITGLNAAQKNVKDGISLVKTAEGAMQEIQDMLNRMDYLATQSANGTYDDPVDRLNLQKEVDALKAEINRIADSANFNGINLLDGKRSMATSISALGELDKEAMLDGVDPTAGGKALVNVTVGAGAGNNSKSIDASTDAAKTYDGVDPSAATKAEASVTVDATFLGNYADTDALKAATAGGVDLDKLFDLKINGADADWTTNTTLNANDEIELVAKNGGALSSAQITDLEGILGAGGVVTNGADEGAATPDTEASYVINLDLTKLEGGQVLSIGGNDFTVTNDPTQTGNNFINISGLNLNDATDQQTLATQIGNKMGAVLANFDYSDNAAAGGTLSINLNAKAGQGAAGNLGEVRMTTNSGTNPLTGYTYNKFQEGAAGAAGKHAQVTYESEDLQAANLTAGSTLKIGNGIEIEIVADTATNLAANQIKVGDVSTKLAEVIEKQAGTDFGLANYNATNGTLTFTAKEGGTGKLDALKTATAISVTAAPTPGSDTATAGTGGLDIEIGTTTVGDLKNHEITIDGKTVKLGDLFDIKVTAGGSTTALGDSAAIGAGANISFEAKQTGKLADEVMNAIKYTGKASTEVRDGWDEGQTGAGNNTHYELNISTDNTKLAGGASFSFGTGDKATTFDITYDDVETGNGTGAPGGSTNEVGADRTKIKLSSAMTDQEKADAIKAAVAGKMSDFNVKVTVDGGSIKLEATAKEATADTNYGGVRFSSAGGAFSGGVYNAYNAFDGGTEGTYAKVSYGFDSSKLEVGDKVTIGGISINVGEKDATEKDANGKVTSITISKENAQNADKLIAAFESAGFQSGQLEIADGKLTITGQKTGQKAEDLAKEMGVSVSSTTRALTSGGLTLQIGDTSDSYNQLTVSIGDMHTEALGIAGIDIGNQEGASAAIQTIRDAINKVSSVRGDLGATQNRLEHTANNLSVMAENIQDAESTIRDTDVAEEMMAYTKNNILVQSAQAMLAQANAVPQGVLQLLG